MDITQALTLLREFARDYATPPNLREAVKTVEAALAAGNPTPQGSPADARVAFRRGLDTLTTLEARALASAWNSSAGNGHAFGLTSQIKVDGCDQQQIGALITSLQNKGIVELADHPETTDTGTFLQFAIGGFGANDSDAPWRPADVAAAFLLGHVFLGGVGAQ